MGSATPCEDGDCAGFRCGVGGTGEEGVPGSLTRRDVSGIREVRCGPISGWGRGLRRTST